MIATAQTNKIILENLVHKVDSKFLTNQINMNHGRNGNESQTEIAHISLVVFFLFF